MNTEPDDDRLADAARQAAEREQLCEENPEPTLGARLGQIGILGWMIVIPALLGLWLGRMLDDALQTGILFSAPLLMLGMGSGFWFAWRWMFRK